MRLIPAFILTIALTGVSVFAVVSDAQCASDGNKKVVSDAVLSVPQCGTDGNKQCASDGNKKVVSDAALSVPQCGTDGNNECASNGNNKEVTPLKSLVEEALLNNPEIKAARARWEASTKRPSQVSTLPNPTIGVR